MANKSIEKNRPKVKAKRRVWTARKEAILRAYVVEGKKLSEIAKRFKTTPATLGKYRKTPEWIDLEAKMREDVYGEHKSRLTALAEPAIDALEESVKSADAGIKLKAATEILDRTGFPKGLQIETEMNPVINLFMPQHFKEPSVIEVEAEDG